MDKTAATATTTATGDAAGSSMPPENEAALRRVVELLFFAYRDFTADPDAILTEYGFGRAHHRAIYFVGRAPGITVSDLLTTLRITKQSLARVLNQLVSDGFIEQRADATDARRRCLFLTDAGTDLEARLSGVQFTRIERALAEATQSLGTSKAETANAFTTVLKAMLDDEDKGRF